MSTNLAFFHDGKNSLSERHRLKTSLSKGKFVDQIPYTVWDGIQSWCCGLASNTFFCGRYSSEITHTSNHIPYSSTVVKVRLSLPRASPNVRTKGSFSWGPTFQRRSMATMYCCLWLPTIVRL